MCIKKNDSAVSNVVGVMLMVSITVILAAVVAAFSFGMFDNVQKTHVVMFTVQKTSSTDIQMVDMGGSDQALLTSVDITAPQAFDMTDFDGTVITASASGDNFVATSVADPAIGSTLKLVSTADWDVPARIVIVGNFADGGTQIIIDKSV